MQVPAIVFLQDCILGAKVERPFLLISSCHRSRSKSSNWLSIAITIFRKNTHNRDIIVTIDIELAMKCSTSSVLYIDKATPPAPVKLNTSRSICSSFPSTNWEQNKEKKRIISFTHSNSVNDKQYNNNMHDVKMWDRILFRNSVEWCDVGNHTKN